MKIPYTALSVEALQGLIEEFVLREGTDYGGYEYSLDQKVAQVKKQLERGEVEISYDEEEGTTNLVRIS